MNPSIKQFLDALDRFKQRVPLDELVARIDELDISFDDIRQVAHFSPMRYQRNLLHTGPGYQALILCWQNGQRSPIHDHRGSSCGVRIIRGVATETVFERNSNGLIYPTHTRELFEGQVCGSQDDDIHQVSNLQPGDAQLVTLHVYSPPLINMGVYSLTDRTRGEFVDPIVECVGGDGI